MSFRPARIPTFFATMIWLLLSGSMSGQAPIISEFLAANDTGLLDQDSEASDWLELVNPGSTGISLEGWSLTDDPDNLSRWPCPALTIPARGYFVIFASGKDRRDPDGELHTNFSLDRDGEFLALVRPDGIIAQQFSPEYPAQRTDVSYGLKLEEELNELVIGSLGYFENPTPTALNPGAKSGLVAEPVANVARGFYDNPFLLTLTSATKFSTVIYTTDGSTPDPNNGLIYTAPIQISGTTILRAIAVRDDWLSSKVTSLSYLFAQDIVFQSEANALAAGFPALWNGWDAEYGLSPSIPVTTDILTSIPSISLVLDSEEMFGAEGIYANPESRGADWERAVSFEWIDPINGEEIQEDAGIRIHGGLFRRMDVTPKKSFRIVFRERYGSSRLKKSIFGPQAAEEADTIVLRANGNDAWPQGGESALHFRDAFAMESMRSMGHLASHSTFCHLYINGRYWGLYNPTERPDAAFSSIYHGGKTKSWDALNADSTPDGTDAAWKELLGYIDDDEYGNNSYQRIQGKTSGGVRDPNLPVLLDVDNMIDYMILNFYIGNADWPVRNYWIGFNRDDEQGFQFYPWDSESSIGLQSPLAINGTIARTKVASPYAAARAVPAFRTRFGDRVHRHFFNQGTFHVNSGSPGWNPDMPENNQPAARFAALADHLDQAIIGESSRWGDRRFGIAFTRNDHWRPECDDLLSSYFPLRSAIVLDQLRDAGLYPRTTAPAFNRHGGKVSAGFEITMSAPTGSIYYTLDGSDPSDAGASIYNGSFALQDYTVVKARTLDNVGWSALNEATFQVGSPRLVVSELSYHPADPSEVEVAEGFGDADDFEFIEFYNPSNFGLALTGIKFGDGVVFEFKDGDIAELPAGGRIVVVNHPDAFRFRYGSTPLVAGTFNGRLSNGGERIEVVGSDEATIVSFRYGTTPPWPLVADGRGSSLELLNSLADPALAHSWRPSLGVPTPGTKAAPRIPDDLHYRINGPNLKVTFQAESETSYRLELSQDLLGEWETLRRVAPVDVGGPVDLEIELISKSRTQFIRLVAE